MVRLIYHFGWGDCTDLVIGHARVEIDRELEDVPRGNGGWVCGRLGCPSRRDVSDDRGMVGRGGDPLPHPGLGTSLEGDA